MRLLGIRVTPSSAIGFAIVAVNILVVVFAPIVARYSESEMVADVWAPPSADVWLGSDMMGRDMFSRLVYGARTSITISLLITLCSFAIGISAGFAAAVLRGGVDMMLSRLVDTVMAIPQLIFCLVILSAFGTSVPVLIATIALLESTRVFRLSRAVGMNLSVMEYVEAAKVRGERLWWVMFREMLPNALPPLIAEFGLRFCYAFLFVAALSFLGLGIQPPYADWGGMVRDNAAAISLGSIAPLIPAAAIGLLTVGVNLLIDGFMPAKRRLR